jgi:hypothetical protein
MSKFKLEDILEEFEDARFDFGFVGVDEKKFEEEKTAEVANAILETESNIISKHQDELKELENLILPFLIKLMNAKEVYIKWPHEIREPAIKKQIERILAITRK